MIEELSKDYVTFARARGLGATRVAFAYVLRNALIPVVTAAGLIVVGLVAGAIYVEVTFALPGIGSLTVDAVQKRDMPLVQGTTLLFSRVRRRHQSRHRRDLHADRSAHSLRQGRSMTVPLRRPHHRDQPRPAAVSRSSSWPPGSDRV